MTTFFITGANRGIGLELTRQALAKGHRVVAGARDPGAEALASLRDVSEGRLETLPLDVTDPGSIQDAAATLQDRTIDVLINNAGIIGPQRQSALDMDFDGLAETLAVNTIAPLRVTHALLPFMRASSAGKVITISSRMGAFSTGNDRIAYRASKAAVNRIWQALAAELKPVGIAAIVMHPGWVRTDMGGSGADLSPGDSAAGILKVIDGLSLEKTGRFVNYDGSAIDW